MPTYVYKARDETGRAVKGIMETDSEEALAEKLDKMGYLVTGASRQRVGFILEGLFDRFRRIKPEEIIMFNLQLANMLGSGLPFLSSLRVLIRQIENKKLLQVVEGLYHNIEGGDSFSEALARYPRVFSELFINMVKAGEAAGKLEEALNRLAAFTEYDVDLRQRVRAALIYPMFLIVIMTFMVTFVVIFVLPQFTDIFSKAGVPLPLPTLILKEISQIIRDFWYLIIIGMLILITGLIRYARTSRGRLQLDRLKLKLPIVGILIRKVAISRFSRTLSTLLASGVSVLLALEIVEKTAGNEVIARVVKSVRTSVMEGESFAGPLEASGEFPPDTIQMIAVGEESGNLDQMLERIADFYDRAVGYSIKKLTLLLEPMLLFIMGGVMGFVMVSILLPLFRMVKATRG